MQEFDLVVKAVYMTLFTIVLREVFAWRREVRGINRQEASTLHDELELNYLGEDINKNRQEIDKWGGINSKLPTNDENFYKLGKSLQQAGVKCLLSTTTLEHILLLNAAQVVRDWVAISKHITSIHMRNRPLHEIKPVPFQRRHGEWLSLVAFMWVKQQAYELPEQYKQAVDKFELLYECPDIILKKEFEIFSADSGIVSKNTKKMRDRIRNSYMKSVYCWPKFLFNKAL